MGNYSFVVFIIVIACIWAYAYYRVRHIDKSNTEGYFLGGRSLPGFVIAGSMLMANLSTEQIVGQNGLSFAVGMEVMAWEVVAAISCVILALVFLPNYMKFGISTIPEFIELRFDKSTRLVVSFLIQTGYMFAVLPVVLYSGSLVFTKLFLNGLVPGLSPYESAIIVSTFIGIVGLLYLVFGGLSLAATSDSIYSAGLLVLGIAIPILGLMALGDGNVLSGLSIIHEQVPQKLNALGDIDSPAVPWPVLAFGLFFNTLFYWNTNQFIVQKTISGKSLKEGQKGVLWLSIFKLFGAFYLCLPGVIAFVLLKDKIQVADNAWPTLLGYVLPPWLYGIAGAIVFGVILSTFVATLTSVTTLFSLDFYKGVFNPKASEYQIVKVGKIAAVVVAALAVISAPMIAYVPGGLYNFAQEYLGFYNIPLILVVLFGFFSKTVSSAGAKICFLFHVVCYAASKFLFPDINFLYVLSVLPFMDLIVLVLASKLWKADSEFQFPDQLNKVNLEPWKYRNVFSTVTVIGVIVVYLIFSPIGLAS